MANLTLDPVLAARLHLLDGVPALGSAPPTPDELRRFLAFSAPVEGYSAPDASVTDLVAPGPHGDVPVRGVTHGHLNIPGLPAALGSVAAMAAFLDTA